MEHDKVGKNTDQCSNQMTQSVHPFQGLGVFTAAASFNAAVANGGHSQRATDWQQEHASQHTQTQRHMPSVRSDNFPYVVINSRATSLE